MKLWKMMLLAMILAFSFSFHPISFLAVSKPAIPRKPPAKPSPHHAFRRVAGSRNPSDDLHNTRRIFSLQAREGVLIPSMKSNISPEHRVSQKESSFSTTIFQGRAVSFRGCKLWRIKTSQTSSI